MNKLALFGILFFLITACSEQEKFHIYMIGDSTMADKKDPKTNPERGWGQALPGFFDNNVEIHNYAVNGRSTKNFIVEGKWDVVFEKLCKGSYLFIQFGHNDQKFKDPLRFTNPNTGYRQNLIRFIKESRMKGAIPVLFSSTARRNFNEFGVLIDTHGLYPVVMEQVAREHKVPFIDLQLMSENAILEMGIEPSKKIYLWLDPQENEYYPAGKQDNTHFSAYGADLMSQFAIKGMKKYNFPFLKHLKNKK